ncbi:MAG: hypothetical protein E7189_06870 [Erysipelotrichaceae bacterium]|jgi:hypothetical protein|nr:hypothetical protein [Erysipelotrichaceae bacterium]
MAKKIFLGISLVIILIFVSIDFYQKHVENSKPVLVLVEENGRSTADAKVDGKAFVKSATDHNGKDILDDEHLKVKRKDNDKKIEFTYILTDDEKRSVSKSITIEVSAPIKSYSDDVHEGIGTEKKQNKVFYYKDYEGIAPRTHVEAYNYGKSASGKFKIVKALQDGEVVGYECQFVE